MTASVISTEALTMRYPSVTALDGLTLTVGPGVTGLVGANGAGKSTLIKILLGLLPADVRCAPGCSTWTSPPAAQQIRRLVGYMPEHDCLPPDVTATEFVVHLAGCPGSPPTVARERAADTLRHVGLYEERYRADRRLLDRHEAAREAGAGAGARPGAGAARRADQRPRPRRP